jgi:hypothetical protein
MMYTIVQHTGYTVGGKPEFKQAVEERCITSSADVAHVAKAGGLLYNSYQEAREAAEKFNYPAGYTGYIPQAKGTFTRPANNGFKEPLYKP